MPLEFTQFKFFCVGYDTGEMSVFDSSNMDIAEEVQFLHDTLDILIECKENTKLKSCIIGASKHATSIRIISFRQKSETFIDIGLVKVKSPIHSICEL